MTKPAPTSFAQKYSPGKARIISSKRGAQASGTTECDVPSFPFCETCCGEVWHCKVTAVGHLGQDQLLGLAVADGLAYFWRWGHFS